MQNKLHIFSNEIYITLKQSYYNYFFFININHINYFSYLGEYKNGFL